MMLICFKYKPPLQTNRYKDITLIQFRDKIIKYCEINMNGRVEVWLQSFLTSATNEGE
jgi:hypothetical protein